ncbi:hypothetical protein [Prauserella rugosa]|nr:hypothetical protein [Prauserella rugosa]KMS91102.1 hypothetical protein ACZ91_11430 [Streptomyces regensis]
MTRFRAALLAPVVAGLVAGPALAAPAQAAEAAAPQPAATHTASAQQGGVSASGSWVIYGDGIKILALPDPAAEVRGLGYSGQTVTMHAEWKQPGTPPYTCFWGQVTTTYVDVTVDETGVRGWVPDCHLSPPPSPTPPQ